MHFWRSIICAGQLDVQEANVSISQLHRIRDHIAGCWFAYGWFTLLALDLWDLVIEMLRTTPKLPKPTQACMRETDAKIQSTPKDQNVDLSNVDQVPSNAHLSEKESQLYMFEDNEAVIKMIIKGRSPTMRHVSRTHRVALDWLFDRIKFGRKSTDQVVESQNQLADILTKGTRDEWHNLLQLFNIMNDTTFSCSHFSNSHPFLSAGKQSEMLKRSQESSSPGSGESKSMLSRLATRRICGTRLFE